MEKPSVVQMAVDARSLSIGERLSLAVDILNNIPPSKMGRLRNRLTDTYQDVKDLASDFAEQEKK